LNSNSSPNYAKSFESEFELSGIQFDSIWFVSTPTNDASDFTAYYNRLRTESAKDLL